MSVCVWGGGVNALDHAGLGISPSTGVMWIVAPLVNPER